MYDLDRLERMILRRVQRDFFFLQDPDREPNDDELDQLLQNLKLRRMREIYEEQLRAAEIQDVTYSEFLTRLLRAHWHHRQETALE